MEYQQTRPSKQAREKSEAWTRKCEKKSSTENLTAYFSFPRNRSFAKTTSIWKSCKMRHATGRNCKLTCRPLALFRTQAVAQGRMGVRRALGSRARTAAGQALGSGPRPSDVSFAAARARVTSASRSLPPPDDVSTAIAAVSSGAGGSRQLKEAAGE